MIFLTPFISLLKRLLTDYYELFDEQNFWLDAFFGYFLFAILRW